MVFLSDNGGKPANGGTNGSLRGGKGTTWEGGVRVPFILNWPDGLPSGKTVSAPVSSLDLLPTFAGIAGVLPSGKPLDGVDILPWLRGDKEGDPHPYLFWRSHGRMEGVRHGTLKAVRESPNAPWQAFDLSADLQEQKNLPPTGAAQEARSAYDQWFSEMPPAHWGDPD